MKKKSLYKGPHDIEQALLYDRVTKIQSDIIQKLQKLRRQKMVACCNHLDSYINDQIYDSKKDYRTQFWKVFLLNEIVGEKLKQRNRLISKMENKLKQIDNLFDEHEQLLKGKQHKRVRKPAQMIKNRRQCIYNGCFKSYGTLTALNHHIRLKHDHNAPIIKQIYNSSQIKNQYNQQLIFEQNESSKHFYKQRRDINQQNQQRQIDQQ